MPLNNQQIAEKWANRAGAAGPALAAAVNGMAEADNPMAKAAASESRWAEACRKAASENRFSRGCQRVTMQMWRQAMIQKGVPNYQNGIALGQPKFLDFLNRFMPHVMAGKAALPRRGTLNDNIRRAEAMIRHNAQFKNQPVGGGGLNIGGIQIGPGGIQ